MSAKVCEFCKQKFWCKSVLKKYCSSGCARKAAKKRREENEQLCWTCGNACDRCSWIREFQPVAGWDAVPTIIKDKEGYMESYKISRCPNYTPMRARKEETR